MVLADVQSGKFGGQWIRKTKGGKSEYDELMTKDLRHAIENVGAKLRARMPSLQQAELRAVWSVPRFYPSRSVIGVNRGTPSGTPRRLAKRHPAGVRR